MNIRSFTNDTLENVDKLLKYLQSNSINYSAHWVGLTDSEIAFRQKKSLEQKKEFKPETLPVLQIVWW